MIQIPLQLVSVLFGGLITLFGTFIVNWWQKRNQRKRLRQALVAEVEYLGHITEAILASGVFETPSDHKDLVLKMKYFDGSDTLDREQIDFNDGIEMYFSTQIYDSNLDKVGLLKTTETVRFHMFYKRVKRLEVMISDNQDATLALESDKVTTIGELAEQIIEDRNVIISAME